MRCVFVAFLIFRWAAALQQHTLDASDEGIGAMKSAYPFYHTTEELHSEVLRLSNSSACKGVLTLETVEDAEHEVSMDVITVRQGTAAVNKVFLLFGEHSRELISPESGLQLLKALCGEAPNVDAGDVLVDSEFQIVLNANPRSRKLVEKGEYCLRENPEGVDLNRNWDEKWKADSTQGALTMPGPFPFSEPETKLLKKIVTAYKPDTFLTVHSGTRGLYMPWAYDTEHLAKRNQPAMMKMLKELDAKHCECPYGAAGKEVGYSCPGTSLDYVYDQLNTSYAFAWEIYISPEHDSELKTRWDKKLKEGGASLLQKGEHLGHWHFLDLFRDNATGSDFVRHSTETKSLVQRIHPPSSTRLHQHHKLRKDIAPPTSVAAASQCFRLFNPDTEDSYDKVVDNWAEAYLDMAKAVVIDLKAHG